MSVRMMFPKNRLAALIRAPGGLRVADAMAQANANLQSIRGACLDDLQAVVEDLEARVAAYPGGYDAEAAAGIYEVASRSFGVAGAFGMEAVDTALGSLCLLLDNLRLRRTWDADAVVVHVRSLRLVVNAAEADVDDGVEQILNGLRLVSARYALPADG
jgi:hypothetical protein